MDPRAGLEKKGSGFEGILLSEPIDPEHNLNCYHYLKSIAEKYQNPPNLVYLSEEALGLLAPFSRVWDIISKQDFKYDPNFAYGNCYTKFMQDFEEGASALSQLRLDLQNNEDNRLKRRLEKVGTWLDELIDDVNEGGALKYSGEVIVPFNKNNTFPPGPPIDHDELHNRNCFLYLRDIAQKYYEITLSVSSDFSADELLLLNSFRKLVEFFPNKDAKYDPDRAYGNSYTNFMQAFDENASGLSALRANVPSLIEEDNAKHNRRVQLRNWLDNLIDSVYANEGRVLEYTGEVIAPFHEASTAKRSHKHITKSLKLGSSPKGERKNETSTITTSWIYFLGGSYNPQHGSSIATKKSYTFQKGLVYSPTEIRCGVQVQRKDAMGNLQITPGFKLWLEVQSEKNKKANEQNKEDKKEDNSSEDKSENGSITHIYFNNLKRTSSKRPERIFEASLTKELETLEVIPDVAVITLPADGGLMAESMLWGTGLTTRAEAEAKILTIATDNGFDFHISNKIKLKLYGENNGEHDKAKEKKELKKLLDATFEKMGIGADQQQLLTDAQLQAVYFHFLKFELTSFIMDTLKPCSFNMTCKDGIDRGGVSSAYYNLIKSIENGTPMKEDEFERALHAAPTLVKGRGMNHHSQIITNAITIYNASNPPENPDSSWLPAWLKKNAPEEKSFFALLSPVKKVLFVGSILAVTTVACLTVVGIVSLPVLLFVGVLSLGVGGGLAASESSTVPQPSSGRGKAKGEAVDKEKSAREDSPPSSPSISPTTPVAAASPSLPASSQYTPSGAIRLPPPTSNGEVSTRQQHTGSMPPTPLFHVQPSSKTVPNGEKEELKQVDTNPKSQLNF